MAQPNSTTAAPPSGNALERLKAILLKPDQERIAELEKQLTQLRLQLEDKESLIQRLDPIIAASLARKISESKEDMAEALAPVMGEAIRRQINEAREDVVDALYPVIGSTIRKSIAEAMKNLAQSVNEKLNQAMSFTLFLKKTKARLSGVNQNELILKENLPLKIREIFLIHKKSGLLLLHLSQTHTIKPKQPVCSISAAMPSATASKNLNCFNKAIPFLLTITAIPFKFKTCLIVTSAPLFHTNRPV